VIPAPRRGSPLALPLPGLVALAEILLEHGHRFDEPADAVAVARGFERLYDTLQQGGFLPAPPEEDDDGR